MPLPPTPTFEHTSLYRAPAISSPAPAPPAHADPVDAHERQRLDALHDFDLLDTPPEASFERIVRICGRVFDVPFAAVSLVDAERQWLKACIGTDEREIERQHSVCSLAIEQDGITVIEHASDDVRFDDNPYMGAPGGFQFYAGAPLVVRGGYKVGTLCIGDTQPRSFSAADAATLEDLAATVVDEMNLRREMTQRQTTEAALREAKSDTGVILESIDDAFFALDQAWRFTYVNRQAERLLDHTRGELLGRNIWKAFPEATDSAFFRGYQRALKDQTRLRFETYYEPLERWLNIHLYPHKGGLSVFVDDVTERRQQDERMRFQARLLAQVRDPVLYVDMRGAIQYWNRAAEQLTGIARDDTLGQPLLDVLPEEMAPTADHLDAIHTALDHTGHWTGEYALHSADNTQVWTEATVSHLRRPDGKPFGILAILRDITERKQFTAELVTAKEQAEEMVRLKSAFLANISHQIRTPLTGIIGFAELLAEATPSGSSKLTQPFQQSVQQLVDTLDSALGLANLEADGAETHVSLTDVTDVTRAAVEAQQTLARDKSLDLCADLPAERAVAQVDRRGLRHVLDALLRTALRFTRRGGVTVGLEADDDLLRLRIAATDEGMAEAAYHAQLLDGFELDAQPEDPRARSKGLSLSITQRLLTLMGGALQVKGDKESGSVFTIHLPRRFADVAAAPTGGDAAAAPTASPSEPAMDARRPDPSRPMPPAAEPTEDDDRPRVLVVEDNPQTRRLTRHMLKNHFRVDTAPGAESALEAASAHAYDAFVLDINLGSHDGVDLLGRIRALSAHAATPAMALTAYALPGDEQRFLKAGFDAYLGKPFKKDNLITVIHRLIQRSA